MAKDTHTSGSGAAAGLAVGAAVAVGAAAVVAINGTNKAGDVAAPSATEAARFLTQATFGPTDADIAAVQSRGMDGWITDQMAMTPYSMMADVRARLSATNPPYFVEAFQAFDESYWTGAITRPDQLRQRMQFALSQLFVVSLTSDSLRFGAPIATTNYYDMLGQFAFKNWRDLVQAITMSPIMAVWLTYVTNDKEDPTVGRTPDENYAREIMQLFSLGTILLNQDGTPKLDASGNTIPTYTHDDIAGMAKCFTGLSWFAPTGPNESQWLSSAYSFFQNADDMTGAPSPLTLYPKHHSISQKQFLGVTIPATTATKSDPAGDVKIVLDTLFHHPNCAPYFAKRMIQQFVTSNPSPAYVQRVANVFDNNGQGVRGDMGAVLRAILLDTEARNTSAAIADPNFGKLREPIMRVTNWARAFGATSKRGHFSIGETSDPGDLNEGVLDAPSVFGFWRAGYVFPHSRTAAAGKVAPEFQIVSELTVAAYINLVQDMVANGIGTDQVKQTGSDVISAYKNELALPTVTGGVIDPNALLDRLNLLLFYGQMSSALRQQILTGVTEIVPIATGAAPTKGAPKTVTASDIAKANLNRVKLAITLSMVSGEYLIQA